MMRKISGLNRSGIVRLKKNSNYKGSYKKTVSSRDQILPVTEASASSDRETNNHSLNMRLFYETIHEQKEEYKHFYHDEQALEHDLKNINFNDDAFVEKIKHLIKSYNHTILSLRKFDKSFNTHFSDEMILLLQGYAELLLSIGIKLLVDGELLIYNGILEDAAKTKRSDFHFLIGHDNSLFFKLYQFFQKVKIPTEDLDSSDLEGYVGTIIDTKC
jgi:hypothetical protein